MGGYRDRVFEGWGIPPLSYFTIAMGSAPYPVDLDPWAFYPPPVLGQSGYLTGAKRDATINAARFRRPFQGPSFYACELIVKILTIRPHGVFKYGLRRGEPTR